MTALARAAAVLGLAAATLALQVPGAAARSCVDPREWYPKADHVFVGQVSDVDGERIQFEVREVWQGEDLAGHVWLRRNDGMDMWFPFSRDGEVEDGYSSTTTYVVAVQDDLVLSPCALAPDDGSGYGVAGAETPRPPADPATAALEGVEPPPERSVAPLAAGGIGVVGTGAVALVLWRRRRT
jgi:hypothetical protein